VPEDAEDLADVRPIGFAAKPSIPQSEPTTIPMRRYEVLGVSLHTQPPGGTHPSTVLSRLLEFCCPHRDSIAPHSPILVGKIRADR
jgi:hypothetical protein